MGAQSRPLSEVLAEIPDGRHSRGKRHPLVAILALACRAILCGAPDCVKTPFLEHMGFVTH